MSAKGRRPPGGSAAREPDGPPRGRTRECEARTSFVRPQAWGDHLANDTLLRALRREPTPYVPVWLMRQAGRYLPEYAKLRARAGSFMALATNPSLATEVTLQPLARFPLDAAILFSDILTIPDAMGLGLAFSEGEGPRFARTASDERAIAALAVPDLARLRYVFDAIGEIKRALAGRVPLIGFAGSPFTLACYMTEGRGSADFATILADIERRDERDMGRADSPLKPAADAHLLDTSEMAIEAAFLAAMAIIDDALARRNKA